MKKRIKLVVIFIGVLFLCGGCDMANANVTRDIRHSGYSVSSAEFECPALLPSDKGYERIKFFSNTFAITTEGRFYELSLAKKYQNGTHCKLTENMSNVKVKAIFDNKVVRTSDGKMRYIVRNGDSPAYSEVPMTDGYYALYRLFFNDVSIIKVQTVDSNAGYYYALKEDGNVYKYTVVKDNNGYTPVSNVHVYKKSVYGDQIIDFNHAGNASGTYIRTKSEIFRMKAQNAEECSMYADVTCEYKIEKDDNLSKHQDRMIGYSGTFLITDYGKEFSAVG